MAVEEYEPVPAPVSVSKLQKNHKKEEPELEVKPAFDLENALPSTDDFRTSLLMPKLSARFSMLREQDDPATKIGKANDDSVLFPKRVSRLNLFGHNPNSPNFLADIAEVSSLRPSMSSGRAGSFASAAEDEADENRPSPGSIMSRARPGEGNNLFGGRQKVYKIPVRKASDTESGESGGLRGRALYEDDVTLSAFQRLRLKEKEERLAETMERLQGPTAVDPQELSPISIKRTTSSSTTSGPSNGRTSTAATSIDEQSTSSVSTEPSRTNSNSGTTVPERTGSKPRRLYGQGLEQAAQNKQSPAFAAISKFESLSRQRTGNLESPFLNRSFSRSANNLHERLHISPIKAAAAHENTPPPSASSPFQQKSKELELGLNPGSAATGYGVIPPLSPPVSENEDAATLAAAMQPEDRGKATAMGLFNKPTKYDEQQFSRRQLQMHEGRNTPPLRRPSLPRNDSQVSSTGRIRELSNASQNSKAESVSSHYSNEAHSNLAALGVKESEASKSACKTFFDGSESGNESEEDQPSRQSSRRNSQTLHDVHPALRSNTGTSEDDTETFVQERSVILPEVRFSDLRDLNPIAESELDAAAPSPIREEHSEKAPDSPTLGPSGLGLSGLIRTHLRHDSDRSSIYPPPSPGFLPKNRYRESVIDPAVQGFRMSTYNDCVQGPDEVEQGFTAVQDTLDSISQPNVNPAMSSISMRAKQMLDQAAALRGTDTRLQTQETGGDHPAWQEELRSRHRRHSSAETQKEREEFANELAERRRKVQEKLRDFAETESRSSSPVPGRSTPDLKQGNAFAMLKNRSMKRLDSPQSKGSKMFGISNSSMGASTTSLVSDDVWRDDEDHELGKHSTPSTGKNIWSRARALRRGSRDESRDSSRSRAPSSPPRPSYQRDGSESDISGRSKSRTRHKEDLGKVDEDYISHRTGRSSGEASVNRTSDSITASTRPSVEASDQSFYERSASVASGRYRSGSRSAPHLDVNTQPDLIESCIAPRPSPIAPYSANATPPLQEVPSDNTAASTLASVQPGSHVVPQRAPGSNNLPKRLIDKAQISEPTFVSSTYNATTVNLPPGASLTNGMESPPVPPMNPRRRRQTTTHTILGALKGEKNEQPPMPSSDKVEERSIFPDEGDRFPKVLNRLRNISSEGASLHGKARKDAAMGASIPSPQSATVPRVSGGMF